MTIVQQFKTVSDYWYGMVIPDCDAYSDDVADLRLALHSAVSLFHMHDWIFCTHKSFVMTNFKYHKNGILQPVGSASQFADSLQQQNGNFGLVRGIANAGKHLQLNHVPNVANAPSHSANTRTQTTGFGQGGFGQGPFGGGPRVMLEVGGGNDIEYLTILNDVLAMWQNMLTQNNWL